MNLHIRTLKRKTEPGCVRFYSTFNWGLHKDLHFPTLLVVWTQNLKISYHTIYEPTTFFSSFFFLAPLASKRPLIIVPRHGNEMKRKAAWSDGPWLILSVIFLFHHIECGKKNIAFRMTTKQTRVNCIGCRLTVRVYLLLNQNIFFIMFQCVAFVWIRWHKMIICLFLFRQSYFLLANIKHLIETH